MQSTASSPLSFTYCGYFAIVCTAKINGALVPGAQPPYRMTIGRAASAGLRVVCWVGAGASLALGMGVDVGIGVGWGGGDELGTVNLVKVVI